MHSLVFRTHIATVFYNFLDDLGKGRPPLQPEAREKFVDHITDLDDVASVLPSAVPYFEGIFPRKEPFLERLDPKTRAFFAELNQKLKDKDPPPPLSPHRLNSKIIRFKQGFLYARMWSEVFYWLGDDNTWPEWHITDLYIAADTVADVLSVCPHFAPLLNEDWPPELLFPASFADRFTDAQIEAFEEIEAFSRKKNRQPATVG